MLLNQLIPKSEETKDSEIKETSSILLEYSSFVNDSNKKQHEQIHTINQEDININSSSSVIADPISIATNPSLNSATTNDTCRLLILNSRLDAHYEILESIALQYPIPWENDHRCRSGAGDTGMNVEVDIVTANYNVKLGRKRGKTEGWGYKKSYFDKYLLGAAHQRHSVNEAETNMTVVYRSFRLMSQGRYYAWYNPTTYAFEIEASCDVAMKNSKIWLREQSNRYCVLHGTKEASIKSRKKNRMCYLTPLRAPSCWFMPLDLPKIFDASVRNKTAKDSIQICVPSKRLYMVQNNTSQQQQQQQQQQRPLLMLLWESLQELMPTDRPIRIVPFGRNASVPIEYQQQLHQLQQQISGKTTTKSGQQLLAVTARSDLLYYYDYHKFLAEECHVHIPLLEPHGSSAVYFPGGNLKWSGSLADIMGHGIPSILHQAVVDIYGFALTKAPYAVYDRNLTMISTRTENNQTELSLKHALSTALKWYGVETTTMPDAAI